MQESKEHTPLNHYFTDKEGTIEEQRFGEKQLYPAMQLPAYIKIITQGQLKEIVNSNIQSPGFKKFLNQGFDHVSETLRGAGYAYTPDKPLPIHTSVYHFFSDDPPEGLPGFFVLQTVREVIMLELPGNQVANVAETIEYIPNPLISQQLANLQLATAIEWTKDRGYEMEIIYQTNFFTRKNWLPL